MACAGSQQVRLMRRLFERPHVAASTFASKGVLPGQKRVRTDYAKLSLILACNCFMVKNESSAKALVSNVWQKEMNVAARQAPARNRDPGLPGEGDIALASAPFAFEPERQELSNR